MQNQQNNHHPWTTQSQKIQIILELPKANQLAIIFDLFKITTKTSLGIFASPIRDGLVTSYLKSLQYIIW